MTENFPNGAVGLLDADLRHKLIAGQGFEKVDISASDLQGERVQDVYSDEMLDVIEPNYRATLGGEPATFEVPIQGRMLEFRTHPLTNENGSVHALIAMSQDITEHKQREQKLTQQARQQQVVADLGQLALETDDLDELMDESSRQVANALGNDYCKVLELDSETEELHLRQGVGWDAGLVGEATVSAVEAESQAAYTLENDHPIVVEDLGTETRFSGPELLTNHGVRSGISTIIGPFDEPWGILGTHDTTRHTFSEEDVSFVQSVANILAEAIERRQYQSELEQTVADLEESNNRLEQFAYAASHDLQEPLRMVSSYLRLIEQRYENELDEEGREFLDFAVNGADWMRAMIEGLLQYSRVETKGEPLTPVDLNEVVADVRDDLDIRLTESDTELEVEELPHVLGDETQLGQVFQNLLDNAITYSGEDSPRIQISAEQNGTECTVSVQDEGIGIDPAEHDRIFDVFHRLQGRDEDDGSGIGLALCERIVERHNGEMWVESTPGEGSTFSITLPAVPGQEI
ncbi:ATP-binding protein [Halostella pelagica]|nr:ATP-binding protein [Halostella pelagica]